jgi:tetratricopeptide (TPR) repeat protein
MSDTPVSFNSRVARAMRGTYEGEKDGALISENAGAKRLVFFERGFLVGAKSERAQERLGEVIVAEGGVTRAQLEEATRFIRSGRKLGRILVELGYLKSGQIETYVCRQIIRIASAMLTSKSQRLMFSTVIPIEAVTLSPVSIGDVFLEAAFHLTDIALYRERWLLDDYVLAQTRDALALAGQMRLANDDAQVLDLVDERNTVGEIVAASPLSEDRTLRLLLALHQAGIVALRQQEEAKAPAPAPPLDPIAAPEPPPPDPFEAELISVFNEMQCQNHWQVLGLARNASYPEIDGAYQDLCRRFDPGNYQHILTSDFQEKLSSVRARLKEAFVTLSSKTSTGVYDRMVDREGQYEENKQSWETIPSAQPAPAAPATAEPESTGRPKNPEEAKTLFKQAKRAYKEQDFWRAIELCRASIELSEDNDPERFHLLGKALSENPRWRQDAEQNLKIAQNLKPWEPRYLVSLAKFYEKAGLQLRARRLYEQVRVMDPDFQDGDELEKKKSKSELSDEDVLDEKTV